MQIMLQNKIIITVNTTRKTSTIIHKQFLCREKPQYKEKTPVYIRTLHYYIGSY